MKRIVYLSSVLLMATSFAGVAAQNKGDVRFQLNYNASTPLGSFKSDVIEKTSFNGLNFGVNYWFNPSWSLGGSAGFQDYYFKRPRAVYSLGKNQSVSAVLANSIQAIPILVKGNYYPLAKSAAPVQPYVSLGVGVCLIQYKQYLGEFSNLNDASASFAAQGGAGVSIPVGRPAKGIAVNLGATYNYVPYNKNGISNLNNLGYQAGVSFRLQ